jgi:D-3-phosphoglycerate dehydrogenase
MSPEQNPRKIFNCLAIASPSFCRDQALISEARALTKKLVTNPTGERMGEAELIRFLKENQADGLIIGTDSLTAAVINAAPDLKAIGKYGVGLDRVDLDAIKAKGIYFGYYSGVNKRSVSELTLCFMLGHQRNIFRSIERMQRADWTKDGGSQLSGSTIGIIGFGHIGTDLADVLRPFNCKLLIHDILDKSNEAARLGAKQVSYTDLLKDSDILTFHVPGGTATHHMFGEKEIQRTKNSALVINTARGSVFDFDATINAVREGRLGGYASDVFPKEPLLASNFKIEDGFYFTPHIGGNAKEAVLAMGRAALDGLKQYLSL